MSVNLGPGFHAGAGRKVDRSAYDRYLGRWSRLFVPPLLTAAEVAPAQLLLDLATGPGEAVEPALSKVGPSGLVVGVDISLATRDAFGPQVDAGCCIVGGGPASMAASHLRITSVPSGEAPLWVREKWVGLSLPLAQRRTRALSLLTSGVLSGPRGFLARIGALVTGKLERRSGFLVETQAAIAILAQSSPEAAAWWQENTPHLLRPRHYFVFTPDVGQITDA